MADHVEASQSYERVKVTKTVKYKSKKEEPKIVRVVVAPHSRVINGKSVRVAGYSYERKSK